MKDPQVKKPRRGEINRRSFLKLSALAGAGIVAGTGIQASGTGAVTLTGTNTTGPLQEKWVATSCLNCPAGCATRVRVANGRAVWITGNPLSGASEGKTCPRAPIGLQVLYDPDRVKTPLRRTNPQKGKDVDPHWAPISWEGAFQNVEARLRDLRNQGQPHRLLILHGLNSVSDQDLLTRFAEAYGTPNLISGETLENEAEKMGRWLADGNYQSIAYDLPYTQYVLAFGAGILESQPPLSRNLRMWGKIRRERPTRAKVVVVDPRLSVTASRADEWIQINPGTDGALALALSNVIVSEGLYDAKFVNNWTVGFPEFRELVSSLYNVDRVAGITGIQPEVIRRIAREFAHTKPAVAWIGTGPCRWPNGSYSCYALFCLNALVGSIDIPGGVIYQEFPQYQVLPGVVKDQLANEGCKKPRIDRRQTDLFPGN